MKLSKNMKQLFVDELRFVVSEMRKSEDPSKKMYFFSAVHAMANRIMNIEFNSELSFFHFVLQAAHASISTRITAIVSGAELAVNIPENIFEKLEESLEEIVVLVEKGKSIYSTLEKISNLAYSTTGNGYYLYTKGDLQV